MSINQDQSLFCDIMILLIYRQSDAKISLPFNFVLLILKFYNTAGATYFNCNFFYEDAMKFLRIINMFIYILPLLRTVVEFINFAKKIKFI